MAMERAWERVKVESELFPGKVQYSLENKKDKEDEKNMAH